MRSRLRGILGFITIIFSTGSSFGYAPQAAPRLHRERYVLIQALVQTGIYDHENATVYVDQLSKDERAELLEGFKSEGLKLNASAVMLQQ